MASKTNHLEESKGCALGLFERPREEGLVAQAKRLPLFPLVSVVMTSFNSGAWIRRSVGSILQQKFVKLELIVVDDGSTDDTVQVLESLSQRDSRLRILSMPHNGGTYRAKNLGISHARGHAITFADSDDVSHPDRLRLQLRALRGRNLVASTCNYVRRTSDGTLVLNRGLSERQALISLMIKREVINEIGWFDDVRIAADDEFFERIRHVYGRSAHVNVAKPLYTALLRDGSLSTSAATSSSLDTSAGDAYLSPVRVRYQRAYRQWYAELDARGKRPYVPGNRPATRPFPADDLIR